MVLFWVLGCVWLIIVTTDDDDFFYFHRIHKRTNIMRRFPLLEVTFQIVSCGAAIAFAMPLSMVRGVLVCLLPYACDML